MRRSLAAALLFACLLSATLGVSAAPPRWHELEARAYGVADYVADFGRIYDSAEEAALRGALIAKRLAAIRAHNAGDAPYKMVRCCCCVVVAPENAPRRVAPVTPPCGAACFAHLRRLPLVPPPPA